MLPSTLTSSSGVIAQFAVDFKVQQQLRFCIKLSNLAHFSEKIVAFAQNSWNHNRNEKTHYFNFVFMHKALPEVVLDFRV